MIANILRQRLIRALSNDDFQEAAEVSQALLESIRGSKEWNFHDAPLHALLFSERLGAASDPSRGYIFVSGSPRSGTTALGKLLNLHPDVAIFTELYSGLLGYHPTMFESSFISYARDRGNFSAFDAEENGKYFSMLGRMRFIGDKRPNFLFSINLTANWFFEKKMTIVHVVRDPFDVAASYNERVRKGTWSENRDHLSAVSDMNMNNARALEFCDRLVGLNHKIIVLDYEFFWADRANAEGLFRELGLSLGCDIRERMDIFFSNAARVREKDRCLSRAEKNYIKDHFNFASYYSLKSKALSSQE